MGEFTVIMSLLNDQYSIHKKLPSKIKVNEEWFRLQKFSTWELNRDENATLAGIPVEVDNSINTFEFVYKKED